MKLVTHLQAEACADVSSDNSSTNFRPKAELRTNSLVLALVPFECGEYAFEKLVAVLLMPAPDHNKIVLGVDPDRVAAVADRGEAGSGCGRPLLALCVQPPQEPVVRSERSRSRRHLNPLLGNDLLAAPLAATQEQVAESSLVASADPQPAA